MTCPLSPNGSHHWILGQGRAAKGQCRFCGAEQEFTGASLQKVTPPKRRMADIVADAYEMGLALSLARDSGCRVNNFNNRGGRA